MESYLSLLNANFQATFFSPKLSCRVLVSLWFQNNYNNFRIITFSIFDTVEKGKTGMVLHLNSLNERSTKELMLLNCGVVRDS